MNKGDINRIKWDEIYRIKLKRGNCNKYPIEHIVIFMAKNYYSAPNRKKIRVLEIGCGSGNNLGYLAKEGFRTYGIDQSAYAVTMSKKYLNANRYFATVYRSCATNLPFSDNFFDTCIESNSIHCNVWKDIKLIFDEIYRVLKPKGRFFGILASDKCAEYGKGEVIEKNTFDFSSTKTFRGQFDGFPIMHFFSKDEIKNIANKFSQLQLELDLSTFEDRKNKIPLGYWLLELIK